MTIPTRALELTLDPKTLTLDDLELFEPGGFTVRGLKAFMVRYSNWTAAEVGQLTVGEFEQVATAIAEKLKAGTVPKASGAP